MKQPLFIFVIFSLAVAVGEIQLLAQKRQASERRAQEETEDGTNWNAFSNDPKAGFTKAMKLIVQAEKAEGPPAFVAEYHYQAARFARAIAKEKPKGEQHYSRSLKILCKIIKDPDRFLSNMESARRYRNCLESVFQIYNAQGESQEFIDEIFLDAMKKVESASTLDSRQKMMVSAWFRLDRSDVALERRDWDAAIAFLKPVINSADVLSSKQ